VPAGVDQLVDGSSELLVLGASPLFSDYCDSVLIPLTNVFTPAA
jgi:hypothetical protein